MREWDGPGRVWSQNNGARTVLFQSAVRASSAHRTTIAVSANVSAPDQRKLSDDRGSQDLPSVLVQRTGGGKGVTMASTASAEINEGVAIGAPPTGHVIEEVAEATRRLMAAVLRTGRDNPHLARIRDTLHEIADTLDEHSPGLDTRLVEMWEGNGPTRHSPVTGVDNPIAPPLQFRGYDDGSIRGETTLDLPYQGPPAKVHGGMSALLLDHALGNANDYAGERGMTAQLTVRYHRVAPLFEPLTVAARQVSRDGRKIHTVGEISTADGEVCVSAEGLFIAGYLARPRAE